MNFYEFRYFHFILYTIRELIPQLDDSEIHKVRERNHWFLENFKFQTENKIKQQKVKLLCFIKII